VRYERLVIEADDNNFSVEFHPRLTVIAGVGRLEREGLINELVGALGSSRSGVHAELATDSGGRFAVFRPTGGRHRVIDVEQHSTSKIIVWGTVGEGQQRQSFQCDFGTKMTGFKLRPITPRR